MPNTAYQATPELSLNLAFKHSLHKSKRMAMLMRDILGRILHIDHFNRLYLNLRLDCGEADFVDRSLECLGIKHRVAGEGLARIPRSGPLVVVANHPFGAVEGLVLVSIIKTVRPDVKIMANYLLRLIPELHRVMIFVDNPFKRQDSVGWNLRPLRESIELLNTRGVLVIFPAGEVSHVQMGMMQVTDPEWSTSVARIVRRTGAPVLPMFFRDSNGPLFQTLGLVHPKMRTILLPHEFLKMRDRILEVEVGNVISPERLQTLDTVKEVTDYLRRRTYLLKWRQVPMAIPAPRSVSCVREKPRTPIAEASNRQLLVEEINQLDAGQILIQNEDLQVIYARAAQIPLTLREIGRQREIAFRAAGEGTGNALDIDRFDKYYIHLFLWDRTQRIIIGGYRLGHVDEIIQVLGTKGLYTNTLFRLKADTFATLGATLEMGRSFIRQENQRDSVSLPLLWKGIASYLARNPRYRTLFGPVSISNDYLPFSKQLIREFALAHHSMEGKEMGIKPRNPFRTVTPTGWNTGSLRLMIRDIDDLSEWISEIEPDRT